MHTPRINTIAALSASTRAIGKDNKLLWHIPEDLKRFKMLTEGHVIIMGRKTFESIVDMLGHPLPNRINIVITHNMHYTHPDKNVYIAHSLEDALEYARQHETEDIFIGGGQHIYEQALPHTDRLYLTLVESDTDGDAFFPPYEDTFPHERAREEHLDAPTPFTWITRTRA